MTNSSFSEKFVHRIVTLTAVFALCIAAIPLAPQKAAALEGWTSEVPITIDNSTSTTALSDFQVKITLPSTFDFAAAQPNGNDIRFTKSDGTTLLDFWAEAYNPVAKTGTFWVKVPSIAASSDVTILMHYGNPTAPSASNGTATFPMFDDFASAGWKELGSMPYKVADQATGMVNGKFYIIGGYNLGSGDPLNANYEYDPATGVYTKRTNMPTARWGLVAAAINNKIYTFAGRGSRANAAEVYNPTTYTWAVLADVPANIADQGITGCSDGTNMYLLYNGIMWRYNVATNTYTQRASVPAASNTLSWGACGYYNGNIYLVGGWKGGSGQTFTQRYNIAGNTWSSRAAMPFGTYGSVRENPVIGNKMYIVQGQRVDGEYTSGVQVYDMDANTWSLKSFGPHAADGTAGGVWNNKIYTFGGRQDTNPYGTDFAAVYDPALEQNFTSIWKEVRGNFEVRNSMLRHMTPVAGSNQVLQGQLQTANYQTSGNFVLEARGDQTANGDRWNSLAIRTNQNGLYNNNLTGYLVPYNDYGLAPNATAMYRENGTSFTQLKTTSNVTGDQRFKVVSTSSKIDFYRIGGEASFAATPTFTANTTQYPSGRIGILALTPNTSGWDFIFTRAHAAKEPTVVFGVTGTEDPDDGGGVPAPIPVLSFSAWPSTAKPASADTTDPGAYELGTRFYAEANGFITALRFYKVAGMADSHVGRLWDSAGNILATVTYPATTGTGWQQANLTTPVAIQAGTSTSKTYISSYIIAGNESYGYTENQLNSAVNNAGTLIHLPKNTSSLPNGPFHTGGAGRPTEVWHATNYWSDVVFTP